MHDDLHKQLHKQLEKMMQRMQPDRAMLQRKVESLKLITQLSNDALIAQMRELHDVMVKTHEQHSLLKVVLECRLDGSSEEELIQRTVEHFDLGTLQFPGSETPQ